MGKTFKDNPTKTYAWKRNSNKNRFQSGQIGVGDLYLGKKKSNCTKEYA